MGSVDVTNQSAYMNGKTAGCAACSDTPPPPGDYSCPQQVSASFTSSPHSLLMPSECRA